MIVLEERKRRWLLSQNMSHVMLQHKIIEMITNIQREKINIIIIYCGFIFAIMVYAISSKGSSAIFDLSLRVLSPMRSRWQRWWRLLLLTVMPETAQIMTPVSEEHRKGRH